MDDRRQFTWSAVTLGVAIGLVFGAANAFIGLKIGMTVSASIPAAVISMGILRGLLKRGTLLENNIVQTVGSAGESLAAGMIFTIPALFILGYTPDYWQVVIWGGLGGLLGVLFMIPLRRFLIVREHGRLTYPEGVACAEVLEAGERGGGMARRVFWALGLAAGYQLLRGLGFWRGTASMALPQLRTEASLDASPALLGVGYIIGPRVSACMLAGAALGWFVIIPALGEFGATPVGPVLATRALPGPAIIDAPTAPRAVIVPSAQPPEEHATVVLSFHLARALDTASSGFVVELPERWQAEATKLGGIAAGDRVYQGKLALDGRKITLDGLSPLPVKRNAAIESGWVSIVLHDIDVATDAEAQAVRITPLGDGTEAAEAIQIDEIVALPPEDAVYLVRAEPSAQHVSVVARFDLDPVPSAVPARVTFQFGAGFKLGRRDDDTRVFHPPHLVSFYRAGDVQHGEAVVMAAAGEAERPRLGLRGLDPVEAGTDAGQTGIAIIHGVVNPAATGPTGPVTLSLLAEPSAIFPAARPIGEMTPDALHSEYVRYIGAGAVAIGGLLSLLKSVPTILGSIWQMVLGALRFRREADPRQRDLPILFVLLSVAGIAVAMWKLPQVQTDWLGAILVCVFGFFFVAVSSRLVGQVGSSSNPISGMTIATLLTTSVIFFYLMGSGDAYKQAALAVGALVAIAISVAGDCSQDLKTGYLVGATPWKQQLGEIIGVLTAALCVAGVIFMLDAAYGFTPDRPNALPAPQANLMALLLEGVFDQNLPWIFIGMGVATGLVVELLGIGSLPFAVGLYLPLGLSTPIMLGGLVRWIADRRRPTATSTDDPGVLTASGFVAGEGLVGVGLALLTAVLARAWPLAEYNCEEFAGWALPWLGFDAFYGLAPVWYALLPIAVLAPVVLWLILTAWNRGTAGGAPPVPSTGGPPRPPSPGTPAPPAVAPGRHGPPLRPTGDAPAVGGTPPDNAAGSADRKGHPQADGPSDYQRARDAGLLPPPIHETDAPSAGANGGPAPRPANERNPAGQPENPDDTDKPPAAG